METIKDFISELKERFTNPFISSFIIAWLITNWRISYGLLFYKDHDLWMNGYKNHEQLVLMNADWWHNLGLPLLIALLYTFGFPYFKAFINLRLAKINSDNESEILKATENGYMPVKKYIELKESYKNQIQEIIKLNKEESSHIIKNNELQMSISELQKTITSIEIEREKIEKEHLKALDFQQEKTRQYKNLNHLQGNWVIHKFKRVSPNASINATRFNVEIKDKKFIISFTDNTQKTYNINSIVDIEYEKLFLNLTDVDDIDDVMGIFIPHFNQDIKNTNAIQYTTKGIADIELIKEDE